MQRVKLCSDAHACLRKETELLLKVAQGRCAVITKIGDGWQQMRMHMAGCSYSLDGLQAATVLAWARTVAYVLAAGVGC
jgi:hypothetical protein